MAAPAAPAPTAADLAQAADARARFPQCHCEPMCLVSVRDQTLSLLDAEQVRETYPVSTSRFGIGSRIDSRKTPPGAHRIAECIGAGAPLHTIFQARRPQPRAAQVETAPRASGEDCITTRILWLDGLEPGLNQGGDVDSRRRCIYIHGTSEEGLIGQAASIGCIRMRAADVARVFAQVRVDTLVLILPA